LEVDEPVDGADDDVTDKDGGKHTGDEIGDSKTEKNIEILMWTYLDLIC